MRIWEKENYCGNLTIYWNSIIWISIFYLILEIKHSIDTLPFPFKITMNEPREDFLDITGKSYYQQTSVSRRQKNIYYFNMLRYSVCMCVCVCVCVCVAHGLDITTFYWFVRSYISILELYDRTFQGWNVLSHFSTEKVIRKRSNVSFLLTLLLQYEKQKI